MLTEIRQSSRGRGVNVEILLTGAEKLCGAYAVEGVPEKIRAIRRRHQHIAASVEDYEDKVLWQQSKLNRFHSGSGYGLDDDQDVATPSPAWKQPTAFSQQDKKSLEERVADMQKDLGGLLRE